MKQLHGIASCLECPRERYLGASSSPLRFRIRQDFLIPPVAQGQGLKMAARTVGVAVTTARSQLQQVFGKTGTNHQAELVALIHRTLTHLRSD